MIIQSNNLISLTDANRNFSKVARIVDEQGTAVILKNNAPKYVILDYAQFERLSMSRTDKIDDVAKRVLQENMEAFKELAK